MFTVNPGQILLVNETAIVALVEKSDSHPADPSSLGLRAAECEEREHRGGKILDAQLAVPILVDDRSSGAVVVHKAVIASRDAIQDGGGQRGVERQANHVAGCKLILPGARGVAGYWKVTRRVGVV